MMLFGRNKEKKELNGQVRGLMNKYDKEQIDGPTFMKEMLDLTTSYDSKTSKKHK